MQGVEWALLLEDRNSYLPLNIFNTWVYLFILYLSLSYEMEEWAKGDHNLKNLYKDNGAIIESAHMLIQKTC